MFTTATISATRFCEPRFRGLEGLGCGNILNKSHEATQTVHIGFFAGDAKDLKILNRTIKIHVRHDEVTLEADTKLVEDALNTVKLVGAKGVDSPRVRRNEEQPRKMESSEKLTPAESCRCRIDIAEAEVSHETHQSTTKWTHDGAQEVGSQDEE